MQTKKQLATPWRMVALLGVLTLLGVVACEEEQPTPGITYEERLANDVDSIKTILDDKGIAYTVDSTGVVWYLYQDSQGVKPVKGDTAFVFYQGKLLDGREFDGNIGGNPLQFVVGQSGIIEGFNIGIRFIPEGGRGFVYIPSGLAYGASGRGDVPSHAILVFNLDLVEVR